MKQFYNLITLQTDGKSLVDVTSKVNSFVSNHNINNGIINLTVLHTSASLLIQENADPSVIDDLKIFFEKLVPEDNNYNHSSEGKDDMPAHIRSALTQTNISLSIINGSILLGQWQGIYLFEHRNNVKKRKIMLHILGD
ncbi:MAG: hypothetical protein CMN00_05095 [Rickettsiales bacterium]|nr:hypothetical protein [Rickettsiales bacterium]|tara:strand:- start:45 stop:461 length:417 start_codon:yes stop_codon:yes gene_type:complete